MKKSILILLMIASMCSVFAQSLDKRLKGVDKELSKVLDTWQTAGFAVAVVEKNKIIYSKGFGYRDYEKKLPVTENTLFAIGSCSKAFTVSLLGILEKEGKVSLDANPEDYVPFLKFYNDEINSNVTIKDLMSHRTGLPRHDYSWYLFPTNSRDSLLMRVAFQEPFTGLREQWHYNNFMYLAQGVIIEKITGKSWEENVAERLFAPVGMANSNLSIQDLAKAPDRSFGYELKNDSVIRKMDYYDIAAMSPAGSINSSVKDMSNWLMTWINGGKFKGEEVIPSAFVSQAMSSQMVVSAGLPGKDNPDLHIANYGYAWSISSYKGHYRVEHGGAIDGFKASTSFYPSDSVGIVVLVNQNGSAVPSVVRNIMADRMLGVDRTDWNQQLKARIDKAKQGQKESGKSKVSDRVAGTSPSHSLHAYTGEYANPGYGNFDIMLEGDSLFAQFPLLKFWLKHYHYDVFETYLVEDSGIDVTDPSTLRINFSTNNTGEISGLKVKFEPTIDALEFKHKPVELEVNSETLQQYVGEYSLSGTTIKVYIKRGRTLYVFVPGQPEYELFATAPHKFSIKMLDGYSLLFSEGENGKIDGVSFIQPNGTFKATRK
jgi:CubicO group peptidase (beta-lactamase class C family)